MGSAMLDRFGELAQSYPIISDVRGMGMMIGLDFSDPDKAHQFVQSALEAGLILGHTLHSNTVVRIAPPLTLSHSEMEEGMKIIEGALNLLCASPVG
jgi:4-aminobutyrate aminotransferase